MSKAAQTRGQVTQIAAEDWAARRCGWLDGVRRDHSLSVTARLVAHVLALEFANASTWRCNPSRAQIAELLGVSEATIKRALADLAAASWIVRKAGAGRGNRSEFRFLGRAVVVPFRGAAGSRKGVKNDPLKGVKNDPFSDRKKGSNLHRKGVKNDPPYIEPYKNHTGAGAARAQIRRSRIAAIIAEAEQVARYVADTPGANVATASDDVLGHVRAVGLLTDAQLIAAGVSPLAEKKNDHPKSSEKDQDQ